MTMQSALDRYYDSGRAEERAKNFEMDKARVQNLRKKRLQG